MLMETQSRHHWQSVTLITNNLDLQDGSDKILLGNSDGDDLEIYHDGSNSYHYKTTALG